MRALVKTASGQGHIQIEEVPLPAVQENQALIRVKCVGVCGTDLKILDGSFASTPPVIVGHEFSGIVEKIGSGVTNVTCQDAVVSEQHVGACGTCKYCLTGKRHLCLSKKSPGYFSDGAYADYIAIDASLLHKIPAGVSFPEAALLEPFAVAAHALRGRMSLGDTVVILGCGPIAILTVQLLQAQGAGRIYVTGLDSDEARRFPIARKYGAQTINVQQEDPVAKVKEKAPLGADLVVDLSGAEPAILQGVSMLRRGGSFCAIGLPEKPVALPWKDLVMKAAAVYFSFSSGYEAWEECLHLIGEKRIDLSDFTQNRYALEDWETAFADAKQGNVLKAIIQIEA